MEENLKDQLRSRCSSFDDLENDEELHKALFAEGNMLEIERVLLQTLQGIADRKFDECDDLFDKAECLQAIIATALWKYHCCVGEILESFVRDFDRLDVPAERYRLYESCAAKFL